MPSVSANINPQHQRPQTKTNYPLQGVSVVITGAGSGIGQAIAQQLYTKGASLSLNGRTESKLTQLKTTLETAHPDGPGTIHTHSGDVAHPETAQQLIKSSLETHGHIDVLVNNAGICTPIGLIQEISPEDISKTLDTNLKGAIYMMQEALKQAMVPASSGLIININSIVGKTPFPYWSVYNASKAGLKSVTDAVSDEQRANGIRVCGIYPGAVDTPLWEQIEPEHRLDPKGMIPAESIAEAVSFMIQQPNHVLINDITITPLNPVV